MAANHLLGIVNDILHHMKLRSGQLTLRPQPQRVEAIVSSCIDVFRSKAAAKGLQVGYSVTPGAPAWAMLDELRVRQMLSNLLSNAIKFTASGSVKVAVLPEQVCQHCIPALRFPPPPPPPCPREWKGKGW